ncbi:unnamed protein product [Peniophora sp. CBMAI 1063]|nr:unnamed protein product [Peniophora sp. CBMAI 1063]
MTRGRKKDHTLPESRTLAAQRNYRDRKAKYVADLERRCAVAEAEIVRLREELAEARGIQDDTSILATQEAHQLLRGCSEMIGHLSSTQQALVRFQERFIRTGRTNQSHSLSSPITQPSNLDLLMTAYDRI